MHSVETLAIVQVIPASGSDEEGRLGLVSCLSGYAVPSSDHGGKMKKVKVGLVRSGGVGLETGLAERSQRDKEEVGIVEDVDVPRVDI